VLLARRSYGFGTVNVVNALPDAGLESRRNYFVVLDELWRALRAGEGMVDRVDALTRLNRSVGVGQVMISHTMTDLLALPAEEDRMKARGFVERSGMVICAGLPASEMPLLTAAIRLSMQEQQKLISWQDPPAWFQTSLGLINYRQVVRDALELGFRGIFSMEQYGGDSLGVCCNARYLRTLLPLPDGALLAIPALIPR
jgi:hypothetical protein